MSREAFDFPEAQRIGVVADTHNQVRPEALAALAGVDLIIHAGDLCAPGILEPFRDLAPFVAVRGNNDRGDWADALPERALIRAAGQTLYVIHDLAALSAEPAPRGVDLIIAGHSHKPALGRRAGTRFLNPGSAGPRRFRLPVTLALLTGREATLVEIHAPRNPGKRR